MRKSLAFTPRYWHPRITQLLRAFALPWKKVRKSCVFAKLRIFPARERRATKLVSEIKTLTYEERLKALGLPTLIYRRERADMVQLYKIMNQIDKVHLQALETNTESRTRGHDLKLVKKYHTYASTKNNFSARCVNPWNSLPQTCVNSPTLNSFKSSLNAAWKHKDNKFLYKF